MKFRPIAPAAALAVLLAAAPELRAQDVSDSMALLTEVEKQPIGMSEKDVLSFLKDDLNSNLFANEARWEKYWTELLLLMTPRHTRRVSAFWIGKYEVSNAQWQVFLGHEYCRRSYTTGGSVSTLEDFANGAWGGGREMDGAILQRAWLYLLTMNADALMPVLNPDEKADWDPLVARAGQASLPAGMTLAYTKYLPPAPWKDAKGLPTSTPPDEELSRPVRGVSWEAALDFCQWSGFHLPLEIEWERAARGPEGRRFAWGDDWNPLALVWSGYNQALKEADTKPPGAEKIGTERVPAHPANVDTFGTFATPECVHHLHGNVSEWVLDRPLKYSGSKAKFLHGGLALGSRGGNYQDMAEVMLAADRNWQGEAGSALQPTHELEGFGFRLAMYSQQGRDLMLPLALRYGDVNALNGPPLWLPVPAGSAASIRPRVKHQHLIGFAPDLVAGVVERQLAENPGAHHAYIAGPAKAVAFLPVKGFLAKQVSKKGDLAKIAAKGEQAVLLGLLAGSKGLRFTVTAETGEVDKKGKPIIGTEDVDFHDPRFYAVDGTFLNGEAYVGAFLVLRPEGVAVYAPDPGGRGSADEHLKDPANIIGYLPGAEVSWQKSAGGSAEAGGVKNDGEIGLWTVVPPIDQKDGSTVNSGYGTKVSLRIGIEGW